MKRTIAVLLSVTVFAAAAIAATRAGDPFEGEKIAKRWCASCHVVSADQKRGSTQAPPFSEIAGKPGLTAASIALFLLRPHPPMPDMNLTRNEASDLAAYIKKQGK
jgi:mono/diheme cytochrome c family protein